MVPLLAVTSGRELAPFLEQSREDFHSFSKLRQLRWRQACHLRSEIFDAPPPAFLQQARAFFRRADLHAAAIVRIVGNADEPAAREPRNDAAHRRRLHLFGRSEFTKSPGSAENQHGKRGKARRTLPGGDILLADMPQKMNRSRMQPVGHGQDVSVQFWCGRAFRRFVILRCF